MSIAWGSWNGHLRVGIDVEQSPSNVTHSTTSVKVTVRYYVQTDGWNFSDSQTLNLSGSIGGSVNFTNNMTGVNQYMRIATRSQNVSLSYSSRASRTYRATLSGAYNGATPAKSRGYTAPYRPAAKPDAPFGLSVSNIDSDGGRLSWNSPDNNGDGLDNVHIQMDNSSSFGSPALSHYNGSWKTAHTTNSGGRATKYYFRVRAHNSKGWGNWSGVRSFTTAATVPDRPARPVITSITSDSAVVGYGNLPSNGGSGFTMWQFQVATDSGFANIVRSVDDTTNPTTGYGLGSGLTRATTHYVRSRAQNSIGPSSWSPTATFTTLATVPDPPPTPNVGSITSDSALFTVSGVNNGGAALDDTQWQWANNSAFSNAATATKGFWSGHTASGLSRDTAYWLRVRAHNTMGWSGWSEAQMFSTAPTVPDKPVTPVVSDVNPDTATVSFTEPGSGGAPITGFEVQVAASASFAGATTVLSTSSPVSLTGLEPGREHFARVRATNDVGTGTWSDPVAFETLSGALVKVNGSWRTAKAYIKVNGTWRTAKVWKKAGGTWRL